MQHKAMSNISHIRENSVNRVQCARLKASGSISEPETFDPKQISMQKIKNGALGCVTYCFISLTL